ncbi:hypothetical protein ACEPAG_358 [Sanghuangporus baumii]
MEDLFSKVFDIFSELHQQASLISPPPIKDSTLDDSVAPIPPIQLSPPHSGVLIPDLIAAGASLDIAQELSEIHANSCTRLAAEYEVIYQSACLQASLSTERRTAEEQSRFFKRLQKIRRHYDRTVSFWSADLVQSVAARGSKKHTGKIDAFQKQGFNPDSIPKLKAFFEINPKPSRADKMYLAKACKMTVKQINIWFQNRRARVKKENRALRSDACMERQHSAGAPGPSRDGYEVHGNTSDSETAVEEESSEPVLRCCSRSSSVTLVDEDEHSTGIKTTSPSFAFPTKFFSRLKEEAFPCSASDLSFPKPIWRRCYTAAVIPAQKVHSISDVVEAMKKLSLEPADQAVEDTFEDYADSPFILRCKTSISQCNPFIIHPPPAPLPSLLRTPVGKTKCLSTLNHSRASGAFEPSGHQDHTLSFRPPSVDTAFAPKATHVTNGHQADSCNDFFTRQDLIPNTGRSELVQGKELESITQNLFLPLCNSSHFQSCSGEGQDFSLLSPYSAFSFYPAMGSESNFSFVDGTSWDLAFMPPSFTRPIF